MRIAVSGKTYEFDPNRFLNVELMAVERETGLTMGEWEEALNKGSAIAITALIWLLQKRHENPQLAFADVVFEASSLDMEADEPEGKAPDGSESPTVTEEPSTLGATSSPSSESTGSVPGS